MKIKSVSTLLVFFMICLFSPTCREAENIQLLKSHLNMAINEANQLETARILEKLLKLGVDPKTLPVEEAGGSFWEEPAKPISGKPSRVMTSCNCTGLWKGCRTTLGGSI